MGRIKTEGDYGCVQGRLVRDAKSTYTYANIGLFSPYFFADVQQRGAFPLRMLIDKAIAAKQATGEIYSGQWYNIGTHEELKNCEKQRCLFGDD